MVGLLPLLLLLMIRLWLVKRLILIWLSLSSLQRGIDRLHRYGVAGRLNWLLIRRLLLIGLLIRRRLLIGLPVGRLLLIGLLIGLPVGRLLLIRLLIGSLLLIRLLLRIRLLVGLLIKLLRGGGFLLGQRRGVHLVKRHRSAQLIGWLRR